MSRDIFENTAPPLVSFGDPFAFPPPPPKKCFVLFEWPLTLKEVLIEEDYLGLAKLKFITLGQMHCVLDVIIFAPACEQQPI